MVAVAVPLVDVLVALPVLLLMVATSGEGIPPSAAFLPVLLAVQLVLCCGIAWLTAAATVHVRDVRNVVGLGLTLLFYVTPVFYDRQASVPERYHWLLQLNLTTLIEGWRTVLLDGRLPPAGPFALLAGVSAAWPWLRALPPGAARPGGRTVRRSVILVIGYAGFAGSGAPRPRTTAHGRAWRGT